MAGIAQNGKKRLIFIVLPRVRTKMRENGKREKNNKKKKQQQKQRKT